MIKTIQNRMCNWCLLHITSVTLNYDYIGYCGIFWKLKLSLSQGGQPWLFALSFVSVLIWNKSCFYNFSWLKQRLSKTNIFWHAKIFKTFKILSTNKVLLKHSHIYSFMYFCGGFQTTELKSCDKDWSS